MGLAEGNLNPYVQCSGLGKRDRTNEVLTKIERLAQLQQHEVVRTGSQGERLIWRHRNGRNSSHCRGTLTAINRMLLKKVRNGATCTQQAVRFRTLICNRHQQRCIATDLPLWRPSL